MSDFSIQLEFTPNPDSLKYVINRSLLLKGSKSFTSSEQAKAESGLASALFAVEGVKEVMLGTNFVSVRFEEQDDMQALDEKFQTAIRQFMATGQPAVDPKFLNSEQSTDGLSETEKRIVEVLENEVRPAVAMDGGDITFEKYEDGFVYLKMQGSCSGCPSSLMTLKMGVETRLKKVVPEIQEVIPV